LESHELQRARLALMMAEKYLKTANAYFDDTKRRMDDALDVAESAHNKYYDAKHLVEELVKKE
jgi:hypothetical protein